MKNNVALSKRLALSIAAIIVMSICLAVTTFALIYSTVSVDNNFFATGIVKINLNDGKPVINENEFLFEPGMTVVKDFFIKNESTDSVYYKIYFGNVDGDLANYLDVKILMGETVLIEGRASNLTKKNVSALDDYLRTGEKRDLKIVFHFPEEIGNCAQNAYLSFDLCADAVQTRNNRYREF